LRSRPISVLRKIRNFDWRRWLTWRISGGALFVFLLHLQYVAVPFVPESPMARPLADHLSKIGAKMYGAYWCEHCQQQKKIFRKVPPTGFPYIECSPGGPGTGCDFCVSRKCDFHRSPHGW
jgi:hypothetical protein